MISNKMKSITFKILAGMMNQINLVSSPIDNTFFCVLKCVLVSIINMHISLLQLLSIYFAIDHSYSEARLSGYYLVINQWEPTVLQGNNWSFIEGGKKKTTRHKYLHQHPQLTNTVIQNWWFKWAQDVCAHTYTNTYT